jgi:hypothetical protein
MENKDLAVIRLAEADSKVRELVNIVQSILGNEVPDLKELQEALIHLFKYLSSPTGRTDKNCNAVDSFFLHDDLWVSRHLPEAFHAIFADISGALHDTVSAPSIADNFESTPEQLLKRVEGIKMG